MHIEKMAALALALATLPIPLAGTQAAQPIEAFATPPSISRPSISPDGNMMIARLSSGGHDFISLSRLVPDGTAPIIVPLDDVDGRDWSWVNDEWAVVSIVKRVTAYDFEASVTRVIAVSAKTGQINRLLWDNSSQISDDIIWRAIDGSPRMLLNRQTKGPIGHDIWPSVWEVDVATGKAREVVASRPKIFDYAADGAGVVRIGSGVDDLHHVYRLIYRDSADQDFRIVDKADARLHEDLVAPSIFLADSHQALALSDKDGVRAVYRYDTRTQLLGDRLQDVPGYDVRALIPNLHRDAALGLRVTTTRPEIRWIDPDFAKAQADLDSAVGAGNAMIESWSDDGRKLIVRIGSPDQAGAYYLFDRDSGKMKLLAQINPYLKARKMAPVSTIRYSARDGLEMNAVLTLPPDRIAKNLALIVLPHPGPGTRSDESWDWWAQFLADRGYAVVQPNYRGSLGFGRPFKEKADGTVGLAMQDDLADAVARLAKDGIADPHRICIAGRGFGGYMAVRAAQRDHGIYRCAIGYGAVTDLRSQQRELNRYIGAATARVGLKDMAPDYAAVSPINGAKDVSIPLLLIHGRQNYAVPANQSRAMAGALKNAGKAIRYVELPNGDAQLTDDADRVRVLQELESFLSQHNPA